MRVFVRGPAPERLVVFVYRHQDCEQSCNCGCGVCGNCDEGWLPKNAQWLLQLRSHPYVLDQLSDAQGVPAGKYTYFRHGTYNLAYISNDGQWVLKAPINWDGQTDLPERAVTIWNQINPCFPAQVLYRVLGNGQVEVRAWKAPFICGTRPTHSEIVKKILEIYDRTGRIVVDAFVTSNFVKTVDGNIVCIDVGNAFFLECRPDSILARQHSQTSLDTWQGDLFENYQRAFKTEQGRYGEIINAIKALLYVQKQRPDWYRASTLSAAEICEYAEQYDALLESMRSPSRSSEYDKVDLSAYDAAPAAQSSDTTQQLPPAWLGQDPPRFFSSHGATMPPPPKITVTAPPI